MASTAQTKPVYFPDAPPNYQLRSTSWTTENRPQGCCANGNYIYTITVANNSTAQNLYRLDLNTLTITKLADYTDLYHANSISIDAENNLLYVATMDATLGIKVIDLDTNTVVRNFQTFLSDGTAYSPWRIAFDRKAHVLYSSTGSYIQVLNPETGAKIRSIALKNYVDISTNQGMETDGEYIYYSWSGTNKISVYTLDGEFVKNQTVGTNYEFEELAYDWDGKFYACFNSSGALRVYGYLIRSFDGYMELSYMPAGSWGKTATNATLTVTGASDFTMQSNGATSWNMYYKGIGYPVGYAELVGKKIVIEFDVERISGSAGNISINMFTCASQAATAGADRLFSDVYSHSIPESGTDHCTIKKVVGTDFVPTSGKEGSYIGFWIFLRADSGNKCDISNFKIRYEV